MPIHQRTETYDRIYTARKIKGSDVVDFDSARYFFLKTRQCKLFSLISLLSLNNTVKFQSRQKMFFKRDV